MGIFIRDLPSVIVPRPNDVMGKSKSRSRLPNEIDIEPVGLRGAVFLSSTIFNDETPFSFLGVPLVLLVLSCTWFVLGDEEGDDRLLLLSLTTLKLEEALLSRFE